MEKKNENKEYEIECASNLVELQRFFISSENKITTHLFPPTTSIIDKIVVIRAHLKVEIIA